jgi:hypothetical protein
MLSMNPKVRTKWVKALVSGIYVQGEKRLRPHTDEYCCLGVLCDLYHKETGNGQWQLTSNGYVFIDSQSATCDMLPADVVDWAGLDTTDPELPDGNILSALNDGGIPFSEIAILIKGKQNGTRRKNTDGKVD